MLQTTIAKICQHSFNTQRMIITLTGFMGVGKSTIANLLAKHLYCKLVDLDRYIEDEQGMPVSEIFRQMGEPYFRHIEEVTLGKIVNGNSEKVLVLSLGGGSLISRKNQDIVRQKTRCIYLKASTQLLAERLATHRGKRPVVDNIDDHSLHEEISPLFDRRKTGYENSASIIIDTEGKSINSILTEILEKL